MVGQLQNDTDQPFQSITPMPYNAPSDDIPDDIIMYGVDPSRPEIEDVSDNTSIADVEAQDADTLSEELMSALQFYNKST